MPSAETIAPWAPDWATHPGEHLAEFIEARGMSQAEFARLAGMTSKHISTIISGENPVTAESALRLERVTGMKDYIWTRLQAAWDLHQARQKERAKAEEWANWCREFPIKELVARGAIPDARRDMGRQIESLLAFLGIGSPAAFQSLVRGLAVQHRQSRAYTTSDAHVVAWLLLGERKARAMDIAPFSKEVFLEAVREIRSLTVKSPSEFEPRMRRLCRDAGVALIFEKPVPKTCLFGSARWLDDGRAVIQMSLRMKSNDHFWWTFFHEAAHILLHHGRTFVDDKGGEGDGVEEEADAWAEETLVGRRLFEAFKATRPCSAAEVTRFAADVGIHSGIVVGMLQHAGIVPHTHLNGLKARFAWADEVG
ncbi:HigA family addiction module antitoxin [Xanthobacter tagetidis]|uniref:Addiction module antidote protein, HigA family n=1 Tax=Xanthobacter tagetidis TaxID=60216 RepID=A0A3L7AFJ2_9HYPH|nr:HigA family addiction module antitoxin [Xanthobacter tagetidis]MBB6306000.1 HTH-type transcriptional regulator/antitoxin HigA [Xanthobacter tagetidis]RLP78510.1 addiction module antidote protein, HigA family [Xanthobacter tagetidis]